MGKSKKGDESFDSSNDTESANNSRKHLHHDNTIELDNGQDGPDGAQVTEVKAPGERVRSKKKMHRGFTLMESGPERAAAAFALVFDKMGAFEQREKKLKAK